MEALRVRRAVQAGGFQANHNEVLRVSMAVSTRALEGLHALAASPELLKATDLAEAADRLAKAREAVQGALADAHLVDVAAHLAAAGADLPTLDRLGVPTDLLEWFPQWRTGSKVPFHPGRSGLRLAPVGAAVPLDTVRLQLSPTRGTIPYALLLLRGLLRGMDRATRFDVVVEPGANLEALQRLAARLDATAGSRVRFVPLRCITVFAQDNARAMRDASGRSVLLVPRAFRPDANRSQDELDPEETARAFGVRVQRSQLYWEGGNIVHDTDRCFVGVDTLAENRTRLGLSYDEILGLFAAEFGLAVTSLGRLKQSRFCPPSRQQSVSGQASFHIDLDVALLGRFGRGRHPRALVADPARGLDFVPHVLSVDRLVSGHFLPKREIRRHLRAEYESSAAERQPLLLEYASTLATHGYRVIGVPDLRVDPRMDVFQRVNLDFGFCNVVPGAHAGRPAVYHFPSGIRALDADATRRIELAGVQAVAVSTAEVASALMLLQGGLHCCCGSL